MAPFVTLGKHHARSGDQTFSLLETEGLIQVAGCMERIPEITRLRELVFE